MNISVIICSYGRPDNLNSLLASFPAGELLAHNGEVVLVYTLDDLATANAMNEFARTAPFPVSVHRAPRRGLSVARNVGIAHARGDLLIFTDDDCRTQAGYFDKVVAEMTAGHYDYGGGGTHDVLFSAPGTTHLRQKVVLKPHTLIGAGILQGCNMFFRKSVFDRLGGFREDMGAGAGTPFVGADDLEMTTRATLAGMTGILIPDAVIIHDHQRETGSAAQQSVQIGYDLARGSFYAYLIMRGIHEAWPFWGGFSRPDANRKMARWQLEQLKREFHGASEYLDYCLKNNVDL